MKVRTRRWLLAGGFAVVLGAVAIAASQLCLSAWLFHGVRVAHCPDGRFRQTVNLQVQELARERTGTVRVWALAHGVGELPGQELLARVVRRAEAQLTLLDAAGKETPLSPEKGWEREDDAALVGQVKLPVLPDGDYRLRARVTTPLGTDSVEATLPLYSPARIHVLTDRPLYEPGHRVQFRAVALRAKDLSPLDGRPGTWVVVDPNGDSVLEERAPAGPWGVVSGAIPLDRGAPTGTWRVLWMSGGTSAEASFQVEPFTLPRFRVEASSPQPFWRAGETPSVEGQVLYSSGAPVAGASVSFGWRPSGAWPLPLEWLGGALPTQAKTDGAGRFRVSLPRVPGDLRGQVTLSAQVTAVDPAGDSVVGGVSVLLSEDALAVSAVTELEGGLVQNYSNRVYLRVTSADGQVLPGAELTVKRAWDPRDTGVRAVADEDGVAALQFDPGVPVNVVIPPMPVRRAPPPPPVAFSDTMDLLGSGHEPSLEDQVALERWLPAFHPCARFVSADMGTGEAHLGVRVNAGGGVAEVVSGPGRLSACLAEVARGRTLSAGRERMLSLSFTVMDPRLPELEMEVNSVTAKPSHLEEALQEAALDARACLPAKLEEEAQAPVVLRWRVRADRPEVEVGWAPAPKEEGEEWLPASVLPCLQARFARVTLPMGQAREDGESPPDMMGVAYLSARPAYASEEEAQAQATTRLGYELMVSAQVEGKDAGSTKLFLAPTELPAQRLRATPVLARGGEEVRVELLRGPGFTGELPEKLWLEAGAERLESKVEKAARVASFRLPANFEGWAEVRWGEAIARVYAAPRAQLALEVAPEKPAYAPGEVARLLLRTRVEGKEGPAAVGLFGVDEGLAQLAPLPGPGALGEVRPVPAVASPAFGVLDGQALAMGRIRGANAAAAALVRVTGVPRPEESEPSLSMLAQSPFEPEVEVAEPFYRVLGELTAQVRTWEEKAPAGETLSPAGMAQLWEQALSACEKRGESVTDAYGRRLKLSRLPPDLLALTDPRVVVVGGTRLSEDVENWGAWVAREAP
ncbi:MG2 domain-containing protein [Hyalangium rubrum]|uniref:MG2 domain-containing protein n=1 Tax=Hyalangium rubrum TaxID=3103134 RepID=A0ABU5HH75_9BACT|nr:MG2 domain-containing protein [Hyalangium sp. s54d21]MDY7232229.1 MG2 domain-containing protein [Hyalangium sp. s54d21]